MKHKNACQQVRVNGATWYACNVSLCATNCHLPSCCLNIVAVNQGIADRPSDDTTGVLSVSCDHLAYPGPLHGGGLVYCVKLFGAQRFVWCSAVCGLKAGVFVSRRCYSGPGKAWTAFKWLRKGPVAARRHRYTDLNYVNRNFLNSVPAVSCMELVA